MDLERSHNEIMPTVGAAQRPVGYRDTGALGDRLTKEGILDSILHWSFLMLSPSTASLNPRSCDPNGISLSLVIIASHLLA